jgi:uncharacterized protein YjdB
LLPVGCGGGGGGGATAPDDFTIPASLSLTADNLTLVTGTAAQVTTTGHYTDRADQDLTASVTLSSSNDAVAVPVFGTSTIMAVSAGTAVIMATWQNNAGDTVIGNITLTVEDATATAVTVTPATASIPEGASQSFTVSVTFNNGITQELNTLVDWSSSDTLIATVDASGVVTGVDTGSATISATFDGVTGDAALTVEPVLVGIELTANPAHITKNESAQFLVTEVYSDGSKGVLGSRTEDAVFSLEDGPITAVISNQPGSKGLLTGVTADGNLTVTATLGSFTDDYQLVIFTPAE